MTIKDIGKPVAEHLEKFNDFFKNSMKSDVSLLNLVINYISKKSGKQIRPTLVFLSAEASGGINESTYVAAAMVEMLHTATLVHDDIVDEAKERRGMKSINALWNNKIAVLVGDYLLAQGLLISMENNRSDFLKVTSKTARKMSESELLQIQKSKEFDTTEEDYFKIISGKTASLISTCCEIGSISASTNPEVPQSLRLFGEYIGLAFQIKDDIFDLLGSHSKIGKPIGNDIKEKKLTLPIIYSFSQVPKARKKEIIKLIKTGNLKNKDLEIIAKFVVENGGIAYSNKKANELTESGIKILSQLPDSSAKESLLNLAKYVIDRDH
jgi:octaprenyl-diphosphate synthase